MQSLFGTGYPITVLFGAFFIFLSRIFFQNDPVVAVNLMSVVFSALCIPVLYAISNKLFGRLAAFLSSLIFSVTPIFLGISIYGKSHTPSIFFLLTGLYYLLCFAETHRRKFLFISSIFIGLMGAARLQDMVLMTIPLSFLCAFGTNKENRNSAKKEIFGNLFTFWAIALTAIVMFHLPYLNKEHHPHYMSNVAWFWRQGIPGNFRGVFSRSLAVSFIFLFKTFTEIGFAISIIGLIFIGKKSPRILFFFLLWIGIPLFFYGNLHTTVPRFLAFILPPLILAQGYMFAKLMNINSPFRLISTAIYCTILYLIFTSIFPLLYTRHAYALLPDYAKWTSQTIGKNAYFITSDDRLFYNYYGGLNILVRPMGFHSLEDEALNDFKQELDVLLEDNIPVYTTSVGLYAYNPEKKFSSLIENNYHLEVVGKKLYEDWHRGDLKQKIFHNRLIRLRKKTPEPKNPL
ncbi:MAG: glycosyltransferase family 39 protein [Candidatus Omnitrophica bacterium]|nr:glycosyltransferase family 39 protein [Candidatus Omnitrophota bacterium]